VTDQGMPKRKRTEQRVRVYTQEELLKEAEQTEIMNRESLAELLKIEEESRVVSLVEVAKRVCRVCVAFAAGTVLFTSQLHALLLGQEAEPDARTKHRFSFDRQSGSHRVHACSLAG